MSNYNYAILLDNLYPIEQNQKLLQYLNTASKYDIILFLSSKENMLSNNLPVFSIADYFNFSGVSIITDESTLQKSIRYPAIGPKIIIGAKYKDYLYVEKFNFELIERTVDDYYARFKENDG